MDEAALAALYPSATPAAAAPAPAPVAPKAQPVTATPAEVEETAEQRIERVFGPEKKADAAAVAKPADPTALPDFIDQANWAAPLVTPVVQELGLGREQVAKLETLHQAMSAAAIDRQSATWASEAAKLPPVDVTDAQRAVALFGSGELKAILNKTGLGNHPALIAFAAAALRSNPYRR